MGRDPFLGQRVKKLGPLQGARERGIAPAVPGGAANRPEIREAATTLEYNAEHWMNPPRSRAYLNPLLKRGYAGLTKPTAARPLREPGGFAWGAIGTVLACP